MSSNANFSFGPIALPTYSSEIQRTLVWNVSPELLNEIPEHWFQFLAVKSNVHFAIAVIYILFMIFSLAGNGVVIWIFATSKSLRTSSNLFVINLAFADFLMMLKAPIVIYNSLHEGYELGMVGCQIFATIGAFSGIAQATTNLCIAYDRYKNISSPLDGQMSKNKASVLIVMTWFWAVPWALMPLFEYWGRFVAEGYLTTCTFDFLTNTVETKLFVFCIFAFSYAMPMVLTIFYYSQIISQVANHEKALRAEALKMNIESPRNGELSALSTEIKVARTSIIICALFVFAWSPYAAVAMTSAFGKQSLVTPTISMVPALCCKLVACFDPYVYTISHPKFRRELNERFTFLNLHEEPSIYEETRVEFKEMAP